MARRRERPTCIRFTASLEKRLEAFAAWERISLSATIRMAVNRGLAAMEAEARDHQPLPVPAAPPVEERQLTLGIQPPRSAPPLVPSPVPPPALPVAPPAAPMPRPEPPPAPQGPTPRRRVLSRGVG